jgi:hypothetical protein
MKTITTACLLCLSGMISAQLKPSIGLGALPADNAAVCNIPVVSNNFNSNGFSAGDTIPHFQLFDRYGVAIDALQLLQTGKPLLLIGGSYTCPVFRQKIAKINQVAAQFAGKINIIVIYVVEAHPKSPDPSPYSGTVWTTSENQSEGILYDQPVTYGARKQVLNNMLANSSYTLSVPVAIDGPCNAWWQNFGPAPNNAYLIKPDGVIYKKHGWFDKSPENITNDITALLAILPPAFTFQLSSDTIAFGVPGGDDIVVSGNIINNTSSDFEVDIIRRENNILKGWQSYLCADVCLNPVSDSMRVYMSANTTQLFKLSFTTDQTPAMGNCLIEFKNVGNAANKISLRLYGSTEAPNSILSLSASDKGIYPTLVSDRITFNKGASPVVISVFDSQGRRVYLEANNTSGETDLKDLPAGVYLFNLRENGYSLSKKIVKL